MAIQGSKREFTEFSKRIGYAECKVVAFNPNLEELSELLGGADITKEPEYLKEDATVKIGEEEVETTKMGISIWLEEIKTKQKFNLRFSLAEIERQNNDQTKFQFINRKGWTTWVDDEKNLPDWFTEKGQGSWRKAYIGEDNFASFLGAWIALDYREPDASLLPDMKKIFKGNVKELKNILNTDLGESVVVMLTIRTAEGEDGPVDYQSVYNKAFLPGKMMKNLRVGGGNDFTKKQIAKFKETIEDPEYGCKDYYEMIEVKDYDPAENVAHSNETLSEDGPDL